MNKKPITVLLLLMSLTISNWIFAEKLEGRQKPLTREEQVLAKKAKLSFADAKKKALEKVPGEIFNWELEMEEGKIIYSFEIELPNDKKYSREVDVDAMTGKIIEVDKEDLKTQKENAKNPSR
ncbi:MAG TPA: PepSY domain-containing protein [Acidobacteriota bacterium]|jgi:uncharacterized membrane protein YkoI